MARPRKNDLMNLPTGGNVTMHNTLVSASHGLNLSEKRLVSMAVAKLSPKAAALPGKPIKILAVDFAKQFGLEPHTAYVQLREAQENLFNRYIRHIEHYGPNAQKIEVVKMRWISSIRYKEGEEKFRSLLRPRLRSSLCSSKGTSQVTSSRKLQHSVRPIPGGCSRTSSASGKPGSGKWTWTASTSSWKPQRATEPILRRLVVGY